MTAIQCCFDLFCLNSVGSIWIYSAVCLWVFLKQNHCLNSARVITDISEFSNVKCYTGAKMSDLSHFSGVLQLTDLDDFIAPSQVCCRLCYLHVCVLWGVYTIVHVSRTCSWYMREVRLHCSAGMTNMPFQTRASHMFVIHVRQTGITNMYGRSLWVGLVSRIWCQDDIIHLYVTCWV